MMLKEKQSFNDVEEEDFEKKNQTFLLALG